MPPKPAPAAAPASGKPGTPSKGKPIPQVTNVNQFNLKDLKTEDEVNADIEKAIAATKASELSKYVAIVTGGANGLGREICKAFAAEGTKVAILDKDQIQGQALATELTKNHGKAAGMFFHCNLVDPKSYENAVKLTKTQLGRIDILVNNAAYFADNIDNIDASINLNFKTLVNASLMGVKDMGAKTGGNGGLVINIADSLAFIPAYLTPVYAATKAAVIKFTTDMGHAQLFNLSKVGFLTIVPNAFKGSKLFDEPNNKVFIPGRDMIETFNQKFNMNHAQQTSEHVAKNIVQIVKTGVRSGIFLIESGEAFKKVDPPEISVKSWLPDKL